MGKLNSNKENGHLYLREDGEVSSIFLTPKLGSAPTTICKKKWYLCESTGELSIKQEDYGEVTESLECKISRNESQGPAQILYWESGKKKVEIYRTEESGIHRTKGPAVLMYFEDGITKLSSFRYHKNRIRKTSGVWYSISVVLGKDKQYTVLMGDPTNTFEETKPTCVVMNRRREVVVEYRFRENTIKWVMVKEKKLRLPSMRYFHADRKTVCNFYHSDSSAFEQDSNQTPAHSSECKCFRWERMATKLIEIWTERKTHEHMLNLSRSVDF